MNSVVDEWERYAREHVRAKGPGVPLGEEWNRPEKIGIESSAEGVVPFLFRSLFDPFLSGSRDILEIGSGGGRFTVGLLAVGANVTAADTSPTMLRLLERRLGSRPGLSVLRLDGRDLAPVASSSMDAVFSYDVFIHLEHWDIYNYLVETHRVLRPGGKAILHAANLESPLGWGRFLRDANMRRAGQRGNSRFTAMTPQLFRLMVEEAGLEPVRMDTTSVRRDLIAFIRKPGAR